MYEKGVGGGCLQPLLTSANRAGNGCENHALAVAIPFRSLRSLPLPDRFSGRRDLLTVGERRKAFSMVEPALDVATANVAFWQPVNV